MPSLWEGHHFSDDELEMWSGEILSAALGVGESERARFLDEACAGSSDLRNKVEALLRHAWELEPAATNDQLHQPGTVIGDCVLLSRVGRGGMAEVYKAIQRPLRRLVAVKVLTTSHGDRLSGLAFEAISTSRLQHPNIAAIYDADLNGVPPCVVMEYVEGTSLRVWLDRQWNGNGPPPRDAVASIVRQIALALREAHARGLVHRDIKPENILLSRHGDEYRVKVVDFGIARRIDSSAGQLVGTPGYISPELIAGGRPDSRSDIFSVGVVLYELLTGRHPFAGGSPAETLFNTVSREPLRPEPHAPPELADLAVTALQKSAADRFQTADDLISVLDKETLETGATLSNPLLSEFPASIRCWCDAHASGFTVAAVSFIWGCVSIGLSLVTGAACVRVLWTGTKAPRFEMIYGYLVEANAGPWYLVGASACTMIGFGVLHAAHRGLVRTAAQKLLRVVGPGDPDPLQRIAVWNRRYFRYITPLILVTVLAFVLIPEIGFRENHAFGWVQADLAAQQVSASYDDLKRDGKIGDLPELEQACDNCTVRVGAVFNRTGTFRPPSRFWFALFLISALGHQVAFTSFIAWVSIKVLFFFGFLSTALLGGGQRDVHLVPDLEDRDDYRFGLGRLDNIYYAVLLLLAAGSVGRFLQVAANVPKGTYYFGGDPAAALIGQPILLLTVVIMLAVLVLTPIGVFLFLTIRAVDDELARLAAERKSLEIQRARAQSQETRNRLQLHIHLLRDRRDTARKQSLLPIRRPLFSGLLMLNLLLIVLVSFAASWLNGTTRTGRAWRAINESICTACNNAPRYTSSTP